MATKETWQGGNMLYPLPVVMVSCANEAGESDIVTVAWTGTICTNPPMLYISLRPERHSYHIIKESGEFVVNLVNRQLQRACDWCGVRSGKDFDKWEECRLSPAKASSLELAPVIEQAPVSLECKVVEVKELGSHHMFLAKVTGVQAERKLLDEKGRLDLSRAGLTAYCHGDYFELGDKIGSFGYSVMKKETKKKDKPGKASSGKPGAKAASKAKAKGEKHAARKAGKLTPTKDRRTTTYHIPSHDANHRRSTRKS